MQRSLHCLMIAMVLNMTTLNARGADRPQPFAEVPARHGWELGSQCYTFNRDTYLDAIEIIRSLGVKDVEIYGGQKYSAEQPFTIGHDMSRKERALVRQSAEQAGLRLISYGVVVGKDADEWRGIFEFAREMGLAFVNCEPPAANLPLIDRLAKEYGVRVAIHNHPKPSHYWNPETVLDAAKLAGGGDAWMACGDTGHWVRSGLEPVACLKKLEGRLGFMHFKDLNEPGPQAHDVPWGTGVNDVWAELLELKRQQWRGSVLIEYEAWPEDRIDEIRQSVDYFNLAAAALDDAGWQPLFGEDLKEAQFAKGGWADRGGELVALGKGDIWTTRQFGDFILDLEFKCAAETNSGVFLRTASLQDWLNTAIEVQILQQPAGNGRHDMGAIYDVQAPCADRKAMPGEWNRYTIIARGRRIHVMLNGGTVNVIDLDRWTEPGRNPDGTPNKFKYAYAKLSRAGFIGLQYHGQPISFRNARIKPIE